MAEPREEKDEVKEIWSIDYPKYRCTERKGCVALFHVDWCPEEWESKVLKHKTLWQSLKEFLKS